MDVMLPAWSVGGIAVLLLSLVVLVIRAYINGDIVSRKQLEDTQKNADRFERAWETSQNTTAAFGEAVSQLGVLNETFAHFLASLPNTPGDESDVA